MGHDQHAVPPGADPLVLTRRLDAAHDHFVSTGCCHPGVRTLVADSWRRSVAGGVDPEGALPRIRFEEGRLREIRAAHPLTSVMPVIRRLLVESAADAGLLVAVSDAAGQLLYVEGDSLLRTRAEGMHFLAGADWSESSAGTNAPGTALALDRPVQILGPEHLSRQVTPWSCSAAPIHDPGTGAMLGVLDVTGGPDVATPQALSLVRATAAAAEAELRIARLSHSGRSTSSPGWSRPRLRVLGRDDAVLTLSSSTSRLSLRHSEILLLLTVHPEGMSTARLAVGLSAQEQAPVTIRAEMSRLRGLVAMRLESRPYRLVPELVTDVHGVRRALDAGQLRRAVAQYAGPVLPGSLAPEVVQIRDDLHRAVRATLLAGTDADALLSFADTSYGREDYDVWSRALEVLPTSSPRRPQVAEHVSWLDAELA